MNVYLFDTNIVSDLVRNPRGIVAQRIAVVGGDQIATSIVVAGELRFGAERKGSMRLTAQLDAILEVMPVLPLDHDAEIHYGRLRANLERRGQPIGGNDMLIAAHAFALGAILVTDNVREFGKIEGLPVENWLRPVER